MPLNVLVVDDSAVMRNVIRKTLGLMDAPVMEIREACNGEEALDILDEAPVDLLFLDVNMPVMTGSELLERMKETSSLKDVPVILLTGEGKSYRVAKMTSLGVCGYLRKPFSPEEFRELVERILNDRGAARCTTLLETVVTEVLESMAFLFCEPVSKEDLSPESGEFLKATMRFSGPLSGEIWLLVRQDFCSRIASNVLGSQEGETPSGALSEDCLGELASVCCNHVLTGMSGEGPTFQLEGPEVRSVDEGARNAALADPGTRAFSVEDQVVLAGIGVMESEK
jgi:two-component system chemotaxis response regulator CheY